MTDDWMESLYQRAGEDINNAFVARLLNEFKYLTSGEKKNSQNPSSGSSPIGDEEDGYF